MNNTKKLGAFWVGRHVLYPTVRNPDMQIVQLGVNYPTDAETPDYVIETNEQHELIWTGQPHWPSAGEVEEAMRAYEYAFRATPTRISGCFPEGEAKFRGVDIR